MIDSVPFWFVLVGLVVLGLIALSTGPRTRKPSAPLPSLCPRQRDEAVLPAQREHRSHWTHGGTCSYCGSLSEDLFLASVRAGHELGPTDKNYKVYVRRPNPRAGSPRRVGTKSGVDAGGAPFSETIWGSEPELTHDKFYFQHLSEEGKTEFLAMLNSSMANIGMPGHFYVLPFFASREARTA